MQRPGAGSEVADAQRVVEDQAKLALKRGHDFLEIRIACRLIHRLVKGPVGLGVVAAQTLHLIGPRKAVSQMRQIGLATAGGGQTSGFDLQRPAQFEQLLQSPSLRRDAQHDVGGAGFNWAAQVAAAAVAGLDDAQRGPAAQRLAQNWAADPQLLGDDPLCGKAVSDLNGATTEILGERVEGALGQVRWLNSLHGDSCKAGGG